MLAALIIIIIIIIIILASITISWQVAHLGIVRERQVWWWPTCVDVSPAWDVFVRSWERRSLGRSLAVPCITEQLILAVIVSTHQLINQSINQSTTKTFNVAKNWRVVSLSSVHTASKFYHYMHITWSAPPLPKIKHVRFRRDAFGINSVNAHYL